MTVRFEDIDPTLTNVENARRLGTSESSIRRAKARHLARLAHQTDSFFTDVPTGIITSRGRTVRLADGSYEKVTYSPAKAAMLETLKYDDMERAIEGFTAPPANPATPATNPATAVLNAADLQIGKASQRGGGTPGTVQRVMQSLTRFKKHLEATRPAAAVLVDNGDIIENALNVPGQAYTNDLDISAQIRTARRLMLEGLKMLAPCVPVMYYVSVPSNHGQVRTAPKVQAGTTDADFGLEISYQLEDVCANAASPALRGVRFVRPEELYETAVLVVSGTKLAFHHGHQTAGQAGLSKWWSGQDHGRMPGWDADILVAAHYHNLRIETSGNGRYLIGVSSSEPSSDWFTNKTGESAQRGMTAFDVLDGSWSGLGIL